MVHRELFYKRARDLRGAEDLHYVPRIQRRDHHRLPPLRALHILGRALANPGACSQSQLLGRGESHHLMVQETYRLLDACNAYTTPVKGL